MAQEAFYNRLREEYKPMVVNMLEHDITIGDLVQTVRQIEATNERCHLQRMDEISDVHLIGL